MSDITAADIKAMTDVLELAALLDHRLPSPDSQRVRAWVEQTARHLLDPNDMLDAVQAFYDRPSPQPVSVGDVIEGARRINRDRLDREADTERDQRAAQLAFKAETAEVAAAVEFGRTRKCTPRLDAAERALQTCVDKATAQDAIREFCTAKREATRQGPIA
jgi:hypothetical protein